MTAPANRLRSKRRLLLASDRSDQSSELASILQIRRRRRYHPDLGNSRRARVGLSGIVVDINLRSPESVQQVRNKLRGEAYRSMPRLFVLADALHHGSMQAWALGATDTICAAVRSRRHSAAHPRRISRYRQLRRDRSRQEP